jgi:hypothetical protein
MATRIAFDEGHTLLHGDAMSAMLTVSPQGLAQRHWPHGMPGPLQLELGIDAVEDAIMQAQVPHTSRGALSTSDPLLQHLPGLQPNGAGLRLDQVEGLFQGLVAASPALRRTGTREPWSGVQVAALLIVRECMHHLGFNDIRSDCPPGSAIAH